MKFGLPLKKNIITQLAKTIRIINSGMTALIIWNKEIEDISKIVKSVFFKKLALLIKGIGKTIENISRKQKGKLLSMLLGTLGHGLFGKLLVVTY